MSLPAAGGYDSRSGGYGGGGGYNNGSGYGGGGNSYSSGGECAHPTLLCAVFFVVCVSFVHSNELAGRVLRVSFIGIHAVVRWLWRQLREQRRRLGAAGQLAAGRRLRRRIQQPGYVAGRDGVIVLVRNRTRTRLHLLKRQSTRTRTRLLCQSNRIHDSFHDYFKKNVSDRNHNATQPESRINAAVCVEIMMWSLSVPLCMASMTHDTSASNRLYIALHCQCPY